MTSLRGWTSRTFELAKPKPIPAGFHEDRRSVYSESRTNKAILYDYQTTVRLQELSQPKKHHPGYIYDKDSPISEVSHAAKNAVASPRVEVLSAPKGFHNDYESSRAVETTITPPALAGNASNRVLQLSEPKPTHATYVEDTTSWDFSEWPSGVSNAAKTAVASARVEQLAQEKRAHQNYLGPRPATTAINAHVLSTNATKRVQELALPKERKELPSNEHFDKVSSGAKNAQATDRLSDLAQPIPRKVRAKIIKKNS